MHIQKQILKLSKQLYFCMALYTSVLALILIKDTSLEVELNLIPYILNFY